MYYTVIKHSEHLRTLEKCRKHSPEACVFCISLVFSNAPRVLSQCNTQLRLVYLLSNPQYITFWLWSFFFLTKEKKFGRLSVSMLSSEKKVQLTVVYLCSLVMLALRGNLAY